MDDLLERVRDDGLLSDERPVVVMLSGGRDSTCLLDLAVRIAGVDRVSALHVNYGLRPDADADQSHCERLAAGFGVPCDVRRSVRPSRGNLQAWARAERYREAEALAAHLGGDIAAGHTATDQVETILYRLASSPSRRALLGMRERDGSLVRPLLSYTRAQTAAHCRARGLTWREDVSNESPAYARSRIRAGLVPALREVHPGAEANVLAAAERLRAEHEALEAIVDGILAGEEAVFLSALRELPAAVAQLVVQRLADDAAAGQLASGAGPRTAEIIALGDRGTRELDLPGGVRAVVEYGRLHMEPLGASAAAPGATRLGVPGRARFGESEVICELTEPRRDPGILDRARIGPELVVRSWRAGDRMAPLGLGGTKSLQDLFTARRIPRRRRDRIAVVESGGEIAWVAGVATSERFKVTASTREAVRLRLGAPGDAALS